MSGILSVGANTKSEGGRVKCLWNFYSIEKPGPFQEASRGTYQEEGADFLMSINPMRFIDSSVR